MTYRPPARPFSGAIGGSALGDSMDGPMVRCQMMVTVGPF